MAPSSPQQSPQQFNKQASPKAANAREVDDKTQHVSQEPTNIPVAVQVNCTSSADSSELWILRRELKALGATQILVGIIQIVFGVPLAMSLIYSVAGKSGVSFWTGIWYIISGSLTIELKRKPTRWIQATTFSLTVALLLFTVLEMGIAVIIAFFNYRSLFQFENTYTILHDVITKHPSHSG
ncbi:high affinity immunoglobulin epsilon receptor subunit beta-like isoform X3 [Heptranchias perlo]|uniref:high affinity immunoglobulin epsilon receptor subunit beta-like isoform X3 n=1 Tax=Heptranchias perlo TaxID=212740 RepID=UPI0035597877